MACGKPGVEPSTVDTVPAPGDPPGAEASTLSGTPGGKSGVGYHTCVQSLWSANSCQRCGATGLPGFVTLCSAGRWACTWASSIPCDPCWPSAALQSPICAGGSPLSLPPACSQNIQYVSSWNWTRCCHTQAAHLPALGGAPGLAASTPPVACLEGGAGWGHKRSSEM